MCGRFGAMSVSRMGSYGGGNVLWQKQFGDLQSLHGHGEGASPALFGDTVVVNCDHEGQSFIVALDKRTGQERWKVDRDEVTSWATPIVVEHAGKPQVIVSGTQRVRGYDLATGEDPLGMRRAFVEHRRVAGVR